MKYPAQLSVDLLIDYNCKHSCFTKVVIPGSVSNARLSTIRKI